MPYKPFDLTGKTVLVTGANSGIGHGIADALAEAGAGLVIWGRRADRNDEAAARFRAHGVEVLTQAVDVSREEQVETAFADAVRLRGDIHAVFANAGRTGLQVPFHQVDTIVYRQVVEANQFGTFFTMRAAARHMVEAVQRGAEPGSLVMTGSSSMLFGVAGNATYAMTKGAIDALTRTLAAEYGRHGIRVNCILPGMIESGFGHKMATSAWIEANASMKRAGTPAELGGIAVYLASDASSYHTGDSIVIDGGLSVHRGAS